MPSHLAEDANELNASRIIEGVQALDLASSNQEQPLGDGSELPRQADAGNAAEPPATEAVEHDAAEEGSWSEASSDEEDEQGWMVAAKSHNSARRKQRKARRRAAWEAVHGPSSVAASEVTPSEQPQQQLQDTDDASCSGSEDSEPGTHQIASWVADLNITSLWP